MNTLLQQAATSTVDHTKAPASFDFELPAAGPTPARFIGYVEVGKREREYNGKKKADAPVALLFFELNGKKHQREVEVDGVKKLFTNRVMIRLPVLTGDKAAFGKLFRAMRAGRESITHMAQMLNEGFLVTAIHNESNGKTYVNLRDADGVWKVGPPIYTPDPLDPDTTVALPVPEATQPFMLLLWDNPTKEQWDSTFIDGTRTVKVKDADGKEVEEERSKNWIQQEIVHKATNFEGSPLQDVLSGLGDLDLGSDAVADHEEEPEADPEAEMKAKQAEQEKAQALAEAEAAKAKAARVAEAKAKEDKAKAAEAAKAAAAPADEKPKEEPAPEAKSAAAQSADDVLAALGL